MSDCHPKLIAVDAEPNHQIVHPFRLGKANHTTHEPLHSRPQSDVFALDFLCIVLAHLMLIGVEMSLVGAPPIGVKLRDPKGLSQRFALQKDRVLTSPEHIRQHLPRAMINGMP